jgi:hypothetical protein
MLPMPPMPRALPALLILLSTLRGARAGHAELMVYFNWRKFSTMLPESRATLVELEFMLPGEDWLTPYTLVQLCKD